MKSDTSASKKRSGLTPGPNLPNDFARRVIFAAQAEAHRRRIRGRVGAGVCMLLLAAAIALATSLPSGRHDLASRGSPVLARLGWQEQSTDESLSYQLAEETTPGAVGDYLLPNAAAVMRFASAYTDASWQYDSYWAYNR